MKTLRKLVRTEVVRAPVALGKPLGVHFSICARRVGRGLDALRCGNMDPLPFFSAQIRDLPGHYYETLKFLMGHLKTVADHSDKNKVGLGMDSGREGCRWGDSVLRPWGHRTPVPHRAHVPQGASTAWQAGDIKFTPHLLLATQAPPRVALVTLAPQV